MQTKLYVPHLNSDSVASVRSGLVIRPRLIEQLNDGLPRKLTLISAPAGFGKTTLVSDWLDHIKRPAAWLSLDEDDNEFVRFWTYVIAALRTILPEVGTQVLALLQSSSLPPSHVIITPLLNELTTISEKIILVLDDYHTIDSETIDQALSFFIEHMPPHMHLVLTSRVDPNLSLARLRAKGQLNELRAADLRFTLAETTQFLEQMAHLSLATTEVAALDQRTEGWIAGLQMAALSLRKRDAGEVSRFIEDFSGSHHYIMDYLLDEVLRQQPAEVQTFLLYSSILDRLCAPLCEAILPPDFGPSRVQEILGYLERSNLFINPLDEQRHWYRYHPLFAELLRHRLEQFHGDQVASLHEDASRWYEQAGLTGPAVRHALAAQAFDRAADLVEQVAPAMIQRSELAKLLTWLDALPDDVLQARPRLALFYVQILFVGGQITQAAARLKTVESVLAMDEAKQTAEVKGHAAAMRAYLARFSGDFDSTIHLSRQALVHLPEQDALLRSLVSLNLAIAYYFHGEFKLASDLLSEIIARGQTAQFVATTLFAIYLKIELLRAEGSLTLALELCQEGLALISQRGWQNFPATGVLYIAFGELLRERNELRKAADCLEQGIKLGQAGGHPHILIAGYVRLAWLRQTEGNTMESHEAIRAALQVVEERQVSRLWPVPPAACYQARLWIAQGNLTAANRWAQENGLTTTDDHPVTYLYEVEYLTLARLLIAQGNLPAAESLLLRLQQAAGLGKRNGSLIEVLILQAITFASQKRNEESLSALEQALGLAEPEGFVRVFLDEGAGIVSLLRQVVAKGVHTSYALRLLNDLSETIVTPQPLIEPLSERELDILRRVAAGYSNQQIAEDLVVAVSTVKKHVHNIYRKLGVESRTQAMAKGKELRLL